MKITPSALIDEITQTSGGTTIQNSYGGLQLHRKAYQKKKKTDPQQRTRSAFTNVQSSWQSLTTEQQGTWNAAADPGISGFQLYSSTNNRMVNQGIHIIPEYSTPVTPIVNDLEIGTVTILVPPDGIQYFTEFISPGNYLDFTNWTAYIKWTGWILPSVYRLPPANLVVPAAAAAIATTERLDMNLVPNIGVNMSNFVEGSKATIDIGIMNINTGQVQTLMIVNAVAIPT